jgi:hypothetical protein
MAFGKISQRWIAAREAAEALARARAAARVAARVAATRYRTERTAVTTTTTVTMTTILHCYLCDKAVSPPLPNATIRAICICPECIVADRVRFPGDTAFKQAWRDDPDCRMA